eukprot:CAMPEP_0180248628 /NCGR_PEP_ID=MMETSP0987-20121128/36831_1 /TAXON_ID=697907 /ORGANISM="non described non described, Strain CCMP2293" /LENGTH=92 /DNA_ID=CAMNT_0022216767 /DNA_START=121 /DNA_END=395 /DNA_ORIENTATION=-
MVSLVSPDSSPQKRVRGDGPDASIPPGDCEESDAASQGGGHTSSKAKKSKVATNGGVAGAKGSEEEEEVKPEETNGIGPEKGKGPASDAMEV